MDPNDPFAAFGGNAFGDSPIGMPGGPGGPGDFGPGGPGLPGGPGGIWSRWPWTSRWPRRIAGGPGLYRVQLVRSCHPVLFNHLVLFNNQAPIFQLK